MSDPASWDLLDEDCSNISDWNDADSGDAVSEVSPAGQFHFDSNNSAAGNTAAQRDRDVGSYPNTFTVEVKIYHDALGTIANADWFGIFICQADERFMARFASGGLFLQDTGSGNTEVGTNLVKFNGSAEWQIWRFLITFTGVTGNGTCDVYLKDSTYDYEKVGTSIPCSTEGSYTEGDIFLTQFGYGTNDRISHLDYIKIASGLYAPREQTGFLDGKLSVNSLTDSLDGKVKVKDVTTNLLDGKAKVRGAVVALLDGKARVKDFVVNLLDGKAQVKDVDTDLLDGKVCIEGLSFNYLDGKVWVKELITGDVKLPFLDIQGNTGAVGDATLPLLEVLGEASLGIDAHGSVTLPALEALGYVGARCNCDLPPLEVLGAAVVGITASGEVTLPALSVEGEAFTDAIVEGNVELPMLRVHGTSIGGAIYNGQVTLPGLEVRATAKVGVVCTGKVTLPLLVIEGEGIHIPVGEGEVVLPLIQVYATANVLVDPRDGCHILEYARWR